MKSTKRVLTYGTFDLFHIGHLNILRRARELGDSLVVAVSTDEFNAKKGKKSFFSYEDRRDIVMSCRYVDAVIPEENWEQKESDIEQNDVSVLVMGDDWSGKFDYLASHCQVTYLPRTPGISSSRVKQLSGIAIEGSLLQDLKSASDILSSLVSRFESRS